MSSVYAGHDRETSERVAIKFAETQNFEKGHNFSLEYNQLQLRREGQVLELMDHDNIVRLIRKGSYRGRNFVVLEYLDGMLFSSQSLPGLVNSWSQIKDIVFQLCDALREVHEKGIVHRDIKPANIFLVGSGKDPRLKLFDFNLAQRVNSNDRDRLPLSVVSASPAFLAPEILLGDEVDQRADICACGILLYSALSGCLPYSPGSLQNFPIHDLPKSIPLSSRTTPLDEEVPKTVSDAVMRAIARKPENRFQTIKEMKEALQEAA